MKKGLPISGVPKELDIFTTVVKETQKIKVRTEKRTYGKIVTIVENIGEGINVKEILKELKRKLGCGGTYDSKTKSIILQGDHRKNIKKILSELGFAEENIDIEP